MEPLRGAFVPVLRPLFRGSRLGLEEAMGHVLEEAGRVLGLSFAPLGPVRSGEEAQEVARRVEAEGYELLLLGLVTFATGDVLRPLLELGVPKVFWALPEAWIGGVLPQNALCGLNLALSLPSLGPAKWLYGPPDPGGLANALAPTAKAVRGLKVLREARLLWLGGPAPGFDRFAERPTTGARVEERDLEAFFAAYEAVAQEEVSRALESWKGLASLGEAGARLARVALALKALARGYDGVAFRDWPEVPERLGVFPSASLALLADEGLWVAPEGDLMGLLSQLVLRAVGGEDPILLDVVAVREDGVLLWHGGEAPLSWATGEVHLLPHFNRGLPAVRHMVLRPGPVSALRITGSGLAVLGGRLDGRGGYWGASGWLRDIRWAGEPLGPEAFLGRWLGAGMPHHLVLARGDCGSALLELARWSGLGLVLTGREAVWGVSWR